MVALQMTNLRSLCRVYCNHVVCVEDRNESVAMDSFQTSVRQGVIVVRRSVERKGRRVRGGWCLTEVIDGSVLWRPLLI